MKLELLTNAIVVDDAIRFVQSNRNSRSSGYSHPGVPEQINEVK